ncbi:MAG TPA: hypothetical protein VFZ25_13040 [Chloroflexota bacterium]|nr:hypothetical protein [Chloroflexota bacterium]
MSAQLSLALSYLSPTLVLVGLSGVFWTTASGVVSPHSAGRLPIVALAAVLGAFLGQVVATHWGFGPAYGDFRPIGATFGALALVVVVRRIIA